MKNTRNTNLYRCACTYRDGEFNQYLKDIFYILVQL